MAGAPGAPGPPEAHRPDLWRRDHERLLHLRLGQLRRDPTVQPWLLRAMVLREPARRLIGHVGFHLPPDAASGIGRAIALLLAREGARVCAADLDGAGAEELAASAGDMPLSGAPLGG
jgi:hypothetical protein